MFKALPTDQPALFSIANQFGSVFYIKKAIAAHLIFPFEVMSTRTGSNL